MDFRRDDLPQPSTLQAVAEPSSSGNVCPPSLRSSDVAAMVRDLRQLDPAVSDAERVEQIRALEELKAAAAAAQATVTAAFAASQEAEQVAAGLPRRDVGRGIAAQVGLAKRESPARAKRYLGWAKVVTTELPRTFAALATGATTEWRAMLVARETASLSAEHRAVVDAEIDGRLVEWGDRQVEAETRRIAYRLDPYAVTARARRAESERRVSLRPAPDTMSKLSALLPVAQGVAVFAALGAHADTCRAAGDDRGRGQIMADTLVERVTGQAQASAVPVEVNLVMTDSSLIGTPQTSGGETSEREEPAVLLGYGPVPAPWARDFIRDTGTDTDSDAAVWLRRLYTDPSSGDLVAMDSRRRRFDGGLRDFLILRDQVCRTPWCDAPIRHLDHVIPAEDGGPTSAANRQGYCEACNYAKQAPEWSTAPIGGDAGVGVTTTTPTGHWYESRPLTPPGGQFQRWRPPDLSFVEERMRELTLVA